MAFQPAPNIMLAEIRMAVDTEEIENTLYFSDGAAVTTGKMFTVGQYLKDIWTEGATPLLTNSQLLREVYMTDLSASDAATLAVPFDPGTYGTILEGYLPTTNCMHIVFKSVGRGRTNRGGNDWGALPRGQVIKNRIAQAYIDDVVAFYSGMAQIGASVPGMQWGFVSRRIDNAQRPQGVFKVITSRFVADDVVDSCRSRKET